MTITLLSLGQGWPNAIIPAAVFVASLIATMWLRRVAYDSLNRWTKRTRWQGNEMLLQATQKPSILWCLIVSIYLALAVSTVPARWKNVAGNGLWTLLVASLTLSAVSLASKLLSFYGDKSKAPRRVIAVTSSVVRVIIYVVAVLTLLDIWGVPTSPILLVILLAALVVALAFRETLANLFAGVQLNAAGHIKEGDYVKLESGEEGHVKEIGWRGTQLEGLDESTIFIPNRKLMHSTVVNYGRPLKEAKSPFRFYSRTHLKELTGLKARNLKELADILKQTPDSVVYYHTHHFLEEHHYLTPEPANDFALWVTDALGDEVMGERLASIDAFDFPTLGALRERIVGVIEEHLNVEPVHGGGHRDAPEGREFYFTKSVSIILPTPYVAHDLREFVEALRKLSVGSLYFHIFESRLRLGKVTNDFSVWLEDSLGEAELGDKIARLDPYGYTMEGLRSQLIQLIEKRVK